MTIIYQIVCAVVGVICFGIIACGLLELFGNRFVFTEYAMCSDEQMEHVKLPTNFLTKIFHLLKITNEILTTAGVRYVAIGGTLLSMVRTGYLTPWDDDGDVFIFKEDFDKKKDEIDALLREHKVYLQYTFGVFDSLKLHLCDDNPIMQQYPSEESPIIDWLMIGKANDEANPMYNYTSRVVQAIFPHDYIYASELFPFRKMLLSPTRNSSETIQLTVPNDSVSLLNRSYGTKTNPDGWRHCYLASSHRNPFLMVRPCQLSDKNIKQCDYYEKSGKKIK